MGFSFRGGKLISIHAPRGGSDQIRASASDVYTDFNPRSPWGERRRAADDSLKAELFQSTLPVGGATYQIQGGNNATVISIHAPRGGSDETMRPNTGKRRYFNPRSPWGERPNRHSNNPIPPQFQSTLPVGGATIRLLAVIMRPLFQSTLPVGGATPIAGNFLVSIDISIHAPRGGSDNKATDIKAGFVHFNPRSPWGERLPSAGPPGAGEDISIHAPRGGSDRHRQNAPQRG